MANWFYLAGSTCFFVGTAYNMGWFGWLSRLFSIIAGS